jgi:hypothetical protein
VTGVGGDLQISRLADCRNAWGDRPLTALRSLPRLHRVRALARTAPAVP